MTFAPVSSWAAASDLPLSCDQQAVLPAVLAQSLLFASGVLYNFTRRRWPGERSDTFRPCCDCMTDGVLTWQWHTADGPGGHSYSYASHCSCYPVNSVKLPGYPVNSITHVKLNGTDLAASQYEIRDRRVLVMMRQADGSRITLPRWQDMTLPTTAFGTVEIEYKYGDAPPADGVTAAAILGWEIALSRQPATLALCRLPKRITSITRQGVTLAVLDPLSLFKDGLTGIPEVDLWTKSLDYGDARAEAEVIDPMRFPRATRSN